jgi:hypothetical protein
MTANYYLILSTPQGNPTVTIKNFSVLDYARVVNEIGALTLVLTDEYDNFIFTGDDIQVDTRIAVMRSINNGTPYLDTDMQWLMRSAVKTLSDNGERLTTIQARCANDLLHRRIVAYSAGSAEAEKTDEADNILKAIVRENLGSLATDTARSIATYLSVQADLTLAPTIAKAFSRRKVLDVLQEVALSSYQAGTYLAFDVVAPSPTTLEFRTYINQRGIDHRWPTSTAPLLFGPDFGNLTDVVRGYDHSQEVTYGYAGGQGIGAARQMGTASDAVRIAQSPFGRIEKFSDARQTVSAAILADEADMIVKSGIPRNTFSAKIVETPSTIYGLQYGFGDYVTAVFEGESIDARIERVRVRVRNGAETIDAQIKGNIA